MNKKIVFRYNWKPTIISGRTSISNGLAEIFRILRYFQPFSKIEAIFLDFYIFYSIFNAAFEAEKMHSGRTFWAWVSSVCQSLKERTTALVKVLAEQKF